MSQKKKHFIDPTDPTKQFISNFSEGEDTHDASVAPKPVTDAFHARPASEAIKPLRPEGKTKRLQLVLRPSLYDRAKIVADKFKISFNELSHIALERLVTEIEQGGGQ